MFRPLLRYQVIVDLSVAVVFAALSLPFDIASGRETFAPAVVGVFVCLLWGAAVALRRWSPPIALVSAWAGAVVQMAFGRMPSVIDLAVFAVLFGAAAYGSRRTFWIAFASALVGGAVAAGYLAVQSAAPALQGAGLRVVLYVTGQWAAASAAFLLAWTFGALARTARRAQENHRAAVQAETEREAEAERGRIARDMHDVVAHSLAVVVAQADGARYAAATDPEAVARGLSTISATARAALADVRVLLAQLRHTQEDGPVPTVTDLDALFARMRAAGVDLQAVVDGEPPAGLPGAVSRAVYRIVQEALTNALRHGAPGPVTVQLAWEQDRVRLVVRNPVAAGPTAHVDTAPVAGPRGPQPASGHGLIGMRERASLVGGSVSAGRSGEEFRVDATIPWEVWDA